MAEGLRNESIKAWSAESGVRPWLKISRSFSLAFALASSRGFLGLGRVSDGAVDDFEVEDEAVVEGSRVCLR